LTAVPPFDFMAPSSGFGLNERIETYNPLLTVKRSIDQIGWTTFPLQLNTGAGFFWLKVAGKSVPWRKFVSTNLVEEAAKNIID